MTLGPDGALALVPAGAAGGQGLMMPPGGGSHGGLVSAADLAAAYRGGAAGSHDLSHLAALQHQQHGSFIINYTKLCRIKIVCSYLYVFM